VIRAFEASVAQLARTESRRAMRASIGDAHDAAVIGAPQHERLAEALHADWFPPDDGAARRDRVPGGTI
jgi:hypothetical protein